MLGATLGLRGRDTTTGTGVTEESAPPRRLGGMYLPPGFDSGVAVSVGGAGAAFTSRLTETRRILVLS